jgi:type IV secretory pathway VirB2 component (pilin)
MHLQRLAQRSLLTLSAFALWIPSAAAQFLGPVPNIGGAPGDIRQTILDVLGKVLNFMALVAVVVIVIAGIRLVIAGADEQQRDKAKKMIMYAIIGLVVIILASAIVSFIADTLAS